MKKKRFILIPLVALVLIAIGAQVYANVAYPAVSTLAGRKLVDLIPGNTAGWTYEDVPIAQSQAAIGNVEKILRYDDAVFRRYTKGSTQVDLYVAYWLPGKMSYWDVGSHNPDSCWISNGFSCSKRLYGATHEDPVLPLKPYEFGRYTMQGTTIDVIFWHLVGGRPNRYEDQSQGWRNGLAGRIDRIPLIVKDVKTYGLDMKREQFFIRVSANQSIDVLLKDEGFRTLLQQMSALGILDLPVAS